MRRICPQNATKYSLAPDVGAAGLITMTLTGAPELGPAAGGAPGRDGPGAGWVGVRGWHERADLWYAVLEGVAFNHRTHLDALRTAFTMDRAVRVCGGGSRSPEWTQLLTDVVGAPFEVTDAEEAGARGAAMLAGVGAGVFTDLDEATSLAVHVVRRTEPRPLWAAMLARRYCRYQAIVAALDSALDAAAP